MLEIYITISILVCIFLGVNSSLQGEYTEDTYMNLLAIAATWPIAFVIVLITYLIEKYNESSTR